MKPAIFRIFAAAIACIFVLASCATDDPGVTEPTSAPPGHQVLQKPIKGSGSEVLAAFNAQLATQGKHFRVLMMEYITAPASGQFGTTIIAKNFGNKQLTEHWVPYDPNRRGDRDITYAVDKIDGVANGGLLLAQLEPAIDNAMSTWNNQSCSTIPIVKVDVGGDDQGFVQYLMGYGGSPGWLADITHAGWLPETFFDLIVPSGGTFIIGATFTFIWVDVATGDPTDMDRNGKDDVAFREIYYNNHFVWSVDTPAWTDSEIDVESIALHESGHGLSQAHFGMVFFDGMGQRTTRCSICISHPAQ